MRGRFSVGVILILALLLGISSLGLNHPPKVGLAQFTIPASETPTSIAPPTDTPIATDTPTIPGPPTDTPTSIIPATSTSTIPSSATPPLTGQPVTRPPGRPPGAPATPSLGIKVDNCARVVWPQGLSLNQGPGVGFGHVRLVPLDDIVFIIGGPERADGLWWWKARTRDGVEGWGINDHMKPHKGECFGLAAAVTGTPIVIGVTAQPGQLIQTAQPASGQELPATGVSGGWLAFGGALVVVLFVAGLIRRRA